MNLFQHTKIDISNSQVLNSLEACERTDAGKNEILKGLDKVHIGDTRPRLVPVVVMAAAVLDGQVDGAQTGGPGIDKVGGQVEEHPAHAAGVGQMLKGRGGLGETGAEMELAGDLEEIRGEADLAAVVALEADIEARQVAGQPGQDGGHGQVTLGLGPAVGAMPVLQVREGGGDGVEVVFAPDQVPLALADQGTDGMDLG